MSVMERKRPKAHDRKPPVPAIKSIPDAYIKHQDDASKILRDAMAETGVTYKELTERLNADGIKITSGGLQNKVSRGTFPAAFLIHCMDLIGKPIV